jgi:biotin synthase-related radical SAM superfamily protein
MFLKRAYAMTLDEHVPEMIRISMGSAIVLGLVKGNLDALPTTVYLLTYRKGKCDANCAFCPQAKFSKGRVDMLSRVTWPSFPTTQIVDRIWDAVRNGKIKRVCIQALNYPTVFNDVLGVLSSVNSRSSVAISVSCQPVDTETMKKLAKASVERIGIPLDAANEDVFDKIKGKRAKGPYNWNKQIQILENAVSIFGKGKVTTHLIVGLGETEKDIIHIIQRCLDMGVCPGLFAFTPISGTALESSTPPAICQYRRIQLARHLIIQEKTRYENMHFDCNERIVDFGVSDDTLHQTIMTGLPFVTSGCPDCNRPYYNEKPGGPLYNYPFMPTEAKLEEIEKVFKR